MEIEQNLSLPISQETISAVIGRTIKSPINISSLSMLGIDQEAFLKQYAPYFGELPWDDYDPRRLKVGYLQTTFPDQKEAIQRYFKDYYTGEVGLDIFNPWIGQLNTSQKKTFHAIQPWRRRSVAKFKIITTRQGYALQRMPVLQFSQAVDDADVRSWPRIFQEAPSHHVENPLFRLFLVQIFRLVQSFEAYIDKASITAHFMSVISTSDKPGDNSPEGAHEDGAAYIVSALVINRFNIAGGESQILERFPDGNKEVILRHTLQQGEFSFQADTGEETVFGNDLWHHVTPFYNTDPKKGDGWRDIIGLDIVIKE